MTNPRDPLTQRLSFLFLCLAAAGAAGAIALAWLPISTAVSKFVIEDTGYYLTAARFVLAGRGATLDGVNPTNGFHPLWLVLLCGVEALFGGSGDTTVHVALTLSAVFFLATGCLLCWGIRRDGAPWLVPLFAALFFFNYRLISIALGGLETAIAGFFVVAVAVTASQWAGELNASRAIRLGILIGFACLARMDAPLLGAIVIGWLAFGAWRARRLDQLGVLALACAIAFVCLVPWFVFSWRAVHHWLPRSGDALWQWAPSPWNRPWTASRVTHALRVTLIGPAGNMANEIGVWPLVNTTGIARITGAIALVLALGVLGFAAWRVRDDARVRSVAWIPIFIGALWAYYTQIDKEHIRYLNPAVLLLFYFAAVVIGAAYRRSQRRPSLVRVTYAVGAIMVVFASVAGLDAYRGGVASAYQQAMNGALYEALAPWLRTHTADSASVGAFNGGIISYYSGRRTVNLDGVMSEPAIIAMKEQRLCSFLDEQHVTYLADNDKAIAFFLDRDRSCVTAAWRTQWREVYRVTWPPGAGRAGLGWIVLARVTPGGHPQ